MIELSTAIRTGILSCREGNGKESHASTVTLFPHVPVQQPSHFLFPLVKQNGYSTHKRSKFLALGVLSLLLDAA